MNDFEKQKQDLQDSGYVVLQESYKDITYIKKNLIVKEIYKREGRFPHCITDEYTEEYKDFVSKYMNGLFKYPDIVTIDKPVSVEFIDWIEKGE